MNTIDMNQVAGLQAVDAEGNVIGTLSVDDLTNLVANNLVKSTQNQIAAQSVSTLSEASTLAASDEYENTLPVDDNPKSVRTLDAAGNPKQTGINALATVVGGLLNISKYSKIEEAPYGIPGKYVKLFTVKKIQGNTAAAIIPIGIYATAASAIVIVKIYPDTSLESERVVCNYLIGSKDVQRYIYYFTEDDGSITIYTTSHSYTFNGYSFIYKINEYTTIYNQVVDSIPDGAVQI